MFTKHAIGLMTVTLSLFTVSAFSQTTGIFDNSVSWPGDPNPANNAVTAEGNATFSNGTYVLQGSGDDIWDSTDEGFYLYTEESGSQAITAQVIWDEPGPNEWSKAGVMIREKPTEGDSRHFTAIQRGNNFGDQAEAQIRTVEGGASSNVTFKDGDSNVISDPVEGIWLRMSRIARTGADLIVFEWSYDGNEWFVGASREADLPDSVAYGLVITSHEDTEDLVQATFQNVQIGQPEVVLVNRAIDPSAFETATTFNVTLNVFNSGATPQMLEIEDIVPTGWTVSNISNSGTVSNGVVSWNYNAPAGNSTLTYRVQAPAGTAESGVWDGLVNGATIGGAASAFFIYPEIKEQMIDAPALTNQVTLDGRMSAGEWVGAASFTFDMEDQVAPGVGISDQRPREEQNGTGYVFHDANNIYVALDMVDDFLDFGPEGETWQHDSTEVYFDGNLSRSNPMEQNQQGFQATVMGDGSRVGGDGAPTAIPIAGGGGMSTDGAWWNFGANRKADDSGYIVEYQVSKSILVPADRTLVGFDVLINGSDNEGDITREAKWGWFQTLPDGTTGEYWNNENGWGLMELTGQVTGVFDWSAF